MSVPVPKFESLKVVTMVIMTTLEIETLNLPAIFLLLPITDQEFSPGHYLQKKQGKIKFDPNMNVPGEILSMRYNGNVRGIIRSVEKRHFPHTIIMDIGTSSRIISVKLAKTIELTGPQSFDIAKEAVESIIKHIRETQLKLNLIHENRDLAIQVANEILQVNPSSSYANRNDYFTDEDSTKSKIRKIFANWIHKHPINNLVGFFTFIFSLQEIYKGELKSGEYESVMINTCFELGCPVNRMAMIKCMNQDPFTTNYNNAQSSRTVKITFPYMKQDRVTGKTKKSSHTLSVNLSGYTTHSGPNFESMRYVYYTFMRLFLQNVNEIRSSIVSTPRKISYEPNPRAISYEEYQKIIQEDYSFKNSILNGSIFVETKEEVLENKKEKPLSINIPIVVPKKEIECIVFDYTPVVVR